jgi:hypothetical protein
MNFTSATSYEFNVTETYSNGTISGKYFFAAAKLGTPNAEYKMVIEQRNTNTTIWIVNGNKAWECNGGTWDSNVTVNYYLVSSLCTQNAGSWTDWMTNPPYGVNPYNGSESFTSSMENGGTAKFTNIQVNTLLPDSLFVGKYGNG